MSVELQTPQTQPSPATTEEKDLPELLTDLLKEQQLTAVEEFSNWHSQKHTSSQGVTFLKGDVKSYQQLIPAGKPDADHQYAFQVDLDACSGCKACVSACHSLNGLSEDETWRDVGCVIGDYEIDYAPVQFTVTTACHHCAEPGCMDGCPVLAYDKDSETGIVRHLDDQCIGCQYCVLKCPYDVPKYHKKKGIVRKCDMCYSRLDASLAPACVQACPNEAIEIVTVSRKEILNQSRAQGTLVPGAPESSITLPSTRYLTNKIYPLGTQAVNQEQLKPECPHLPLVGMLVLTQWSAGMFVLMALSVSTLSDLSLFVGAIVATGAALAGMTASVLHLGQPLKAWRSFLGWRKSWLSREIIAFGGFAKLAMISVAGFAILNLLELKDAQLYEHLLGGDALSVSSALSTLAPYQVLVEVGVNYVLAATAIAGAVSVFCSIMVYADTQRAFWSLSITGFRFVATSLFLGLGAMASLVLFTSEFLGSYGSALLWGAMIVGLFRYAAESWFLSRYSGGVWNDLRKSVELHYGPLQLATHFRYASLKVSIILFVSAAWTFNPWVATGGLAVAVASELGERYLFFRGCGVSKMPGGMS